MSYPAPDADYHFAPEARLHDFAVAVLEKVGVPSDDAATVAEILIAADLRGIESHGLARLDSFYVSRIRAGNLEPRRVDTVAHDTPTTLVLDAHNGMGHPVSKRAMLGAIAKAKATGTGFAVVRNSNHFGIAGYYAMLALEHDMIGICSTNSGLYGAPTFGRDLMLGTNPWAYAIPANEEPAFVLDFATTTVPRGKLEVYERRGKALSPGWAIDATGHETTDPVAGLTGALLPLGGFGTTNGGHKGYGLGLLSDIMCGVLSGGTLVTGQPLRNDPLVHGHVSHFFGAIAISAFRDPAAFRADMDEELRAFKRSALAPGAERIYVAGEIEHEKTLRHRKDGVPVHDKVWNELQRLASDLNVPFAII